MQIEIVSHCWRYWRCLTYQASGLILHPPPSGLQVVFHLLITAEDSATEKRVAELQELTWAENVIFQITRLPPDRLFRRAIGRNIAAMGTKADVVWFTDCDYIISGRALTDVAEFASRTAAVFFYPREVLHATCDRSEKLIDRATNSSGPLDFPRADTTPQNFGRAIGGIQIVHGDVCRQHGYLNSVQKWQRPAMKWQRCFEDVAFRQYLARQGIRAVSAPIRDVCRLYHIQRDKQDAQWER